MPRDYEDAYKLFIDYINKQIDSLNSKLKNIDYFDMVRNIYNALKNGDYSVFINNYEVLSNINSNIKDELDNIKFFVQNGVTSIPQMKEAISSILNDKELLRIVSNTESKEMMIGKLKKLESISNGEADFETLKNALLNSDLDDEDIIAILTHEAQKTVSDEKKFLPSLEEDNSFNNEITKKHSEILDKINELLEKYYYLIESKPQNLIEMYRKTLNASKIEDISSIYTEKDVLACLFLINLLDLKTEANELLNSRPIDYSLIEVNTEELFERYNLAVEAIKNYEKELTDSIPLDASVYFVLDNGNPLFDVNSFNDEVKKNIVSLLKDLEMGLYDYERSKNAHTIVKQSIRKELNVFVNRKRNTSISFIRINSSSLKDSKVLILGIDESKNIFDKTKSILRSASSLIDSSILLISENNEEFISKEVAFKETLDKELSKGEVLS